MAEKMAFFLCFIMILGCAGCANDPLLKELGLGGNGCDGSCKRRDPVPDRTPAPAPQPKRPSRPEPRPCPGPGPCPRPYQTGGPK